MAQDNEVKAPCYMPTPENTAGNTSGESSTAGMGTSSGEQAIFAPPSDEINGSASGENRSAQYKYPSVSQDIPDDARNQY